MAKNRTRRKYNRDNRNFDNVVPLSDFSNNTPQRHRKKRVDIIPRNQNQEEYLFAIDDYTVIFGIGPAGTGKTLLATLNAIQGLKNNLIEKVVITRPAVSVDEQHGFLPGSLVEKMAPWTRPVFDIFEEYYSPKQIEFMVQEGIIEVAPLAYMRGRTFKNSLIIFDEAQNSTPSQMKMVLTRIGENSKMIVTGDLKQHDRGYEDNGLKDFVARLEASNPQLIKAVQFTKDDIERSDVVEEVLKIYKED